MPLGSRRQALVMPNPLPFLLAALFAAPAAPAKISIEKAERIAVAHVPGGVVEQIERDHHRGRPVFEVDVRAPDGREHELDIDATDGKIIAEEIDSDD